MKKKGRERRREGEEEEKGDEPPLDLVAEFATVSRFELPTLYYFLKNVLDV